MKVYFRGKYHIDCKKTAYSTTCQYCGEKVIYWECYCGCKVFFNPLFRDNHTLGAESDHKKTCPSFPSKATIGKQTNGKSRKRTIPMMYGELGADPFRRQHETEKEREKDREYLNGRARVAAEVLATWLDKEDKVHHPESTEFQIRVYWSPRLKKWRYELKTKDLTGQTRNGKNHTASRRIGEKVPKLSTSSTNYTRLARTMLSHKEVKHNFTEGNHNKEALKQLILENYEWAKRLAREMDTDSQIFLYIVHAKEFNYKPHVTA